MRPLTVFIEFDRTVYSNGSTWKHIGKFRGRFKDGHFTRYYWGCFAIAFVRMSLFDYNRHVASGATEWVG